MKGRCRKVISEMKVFTNNAEPNSLASPFISGFLKSNPFLKNTYNIHGYVFVNIVWQKCICAKIHLKQESIPVRCVPPTLVATTRCQFLPLGIATPNTYLPLGIATPNTYLTQVYLPPGYTYLPGHLPPGIPTPSRIPTSHPKKGHGTRDTPQKTRHTPMKTLPSPTSLAGGKKVLLAWFTSMNGSAASNRK